MAIDSLDIWIEDFKKIPFDTLGSIAPILVTAFLQQKTKNLSLSLVTFTPEIQFTWVSQIFLNAIIPICLTPSPIINIPAIQFASAFSQSVSASVNLIITPSSLFYPPQGNGVVGAATAIIDPASISRGASIIYNRLASASFADTTAFPSAFYNGFNALTVTVTGVDTSPSPPLPISFPITPVK